MSVDPGTMQSMLTRSLMQQPQGGSYGGGISGPQMQSRANPLTGASDIAQKLMLIHALQQQPQGGLPTQANPMANPQMMGGMQAQPQIPQAQQMTGGVNG